MTELCDFQGEALSGYQRKLVMRYFILALFRLDLVTEGDLDAMASCNHELINHEIMWSFLN